MVAHPPVDPGLLPVHSAGKRPEDALGAQVFALLGGDVLARREVVAAAEMPVPGAGRDPSGCERREARAAPVPTTAAYTG